MLIALRALRDAGLNPAKDLNLTLAGNQRNAIARMLKGEAVAAVASASTVASLPPELAQNVRVLLRAPKGLTPMGFAVHPRLRSRLNESVQPFTYSGAATRQSCAGPFCKCRTLPRGRQCSRLHSKKIMWPSHLPTWPRKTPW